MSPLQFEPLLDALRTRGFSIGVGDYLRLQQLLTAWSGSVSPRQIKRLIAPIVTRSADEQARFYAIFEEVYPLLHLPARGSERYGFSRPDPGREIERLPEPEVVEPPARWKRPALVAATMFVVGAGSLWLAQQRTDAVDGVIGAGAAIVDSQLVAVAPGVDVDIQEGTPSAEDPTGERTPDQDRDTDLADTASAGEGEPTSDPASARASATQPTPQIRQPNRWVRGLAIAVPLLLMILFEWRARRRRRYVLQSHRSRRPPISWDAFPRDVGASPFDDGQMRGAARRLLQREPGESVSLSVADTIKATIAARGFPSLRFRSHPRVPDYVALVQRAGPRDHQAQLFGRLVEDLASEEVPVSRYEFESDPRLLASIGESRPPTVHDLVAREGSARLLIFGDGDGFLDPVSGRLQPWVEKTISWERRALLTPVPTRDWGAREARACPALRRASGDHRGGSRRRRAP